MSGAMYLKHGKTNTSEYNIWRGMLKRCHSLNSPDYKNYGGRGIRVKFKSFEEFYAEVGQRPGPRFTIDRIDNDQSYEPGNVRWATESEQASNRRKRTHCKRGHEFTPENTITPPSGGRHCRMCGRLLRRIPPELHKKNYWIKKTHCKRGHEFVEENVYINRRGKRSCKECNRQRARGYRKAKTIITSPL